MEAFTDTLPIVCNGFNVAAGRFTLLLSDVGDLTRRFHTMFVSLFGL